MAVNGDGDGGSGGDGGGGGGDGKLVVGRLATTSAGMTVAVAWVAATATATEVHCVSPALCRETAVMPPMALVAAVRLLEELTRTV